MLVREGRDVYLLNRSGGHREFLEWPRSAPGSASASSPPTRSIRAASCRSTTSRPTSACRPAAPRAWASRCSKSLACGTPVVASAVGGLVETVRNGVTGWSVPPGDAARAWRPRFATCSIVPMRPGAAPQAGAAMVRERFEQRGRVRRASRDLARGSAARHARDGRISRDRVAVLHDMVEEGWPSMDQMGHLLTTARPDVRARPVRSRAIRHPHGAGSCRSGRCGRVRPAVLRRSRPQPDGALPAARAARRARPLRPLPRRRSQLRAARARAAAAPTIVTCHDIDTFRSLVEPDRIPRPARFRAMTRRILARSPARRGIVVCGSEAPRATIWCGSSLSIRPGCGSCRTGSIPPCSTSRPEAARQRAAELLPTAAWRLRRAARRQRHSRASGSTG